MPLEISTETLFGTPSRRALFEKIVSAVELLESPEAKEIKCTRRPLSHLRLPLIPRALYIYGSFLTGKQPKDIDLLFEVDREEYEKEISDIDMFSLFDARRDVLPGMLKRTLFGKGAKVDLHTFKEDIAATLKQMRTTRLKDLSAVKETRWLKVWDKSDPTVWKRMSEAYRESTERGRHRRMEVNRMKHPTEAPPSVTRIPFLLTEAEVVEEEGESQIVVYMSSEWETPRYLKGVARRTMVNLACMSRQEDRFATLLYYFFRELSEDSDMSSNQDQSYRKKVQRYLDWYEKHGHLVYESGTAKRFIPWLRNVFDNLSEPPKSERDFLGLFGLTVQWISKYKWRIFVPNERINYPTKEFKVPDPPGVWKKWLGV